MAQILLISQTEVINLAIIEKNFQTEKIKDAVIFDKQYNVIRPALGEDLYNEIIAQIEAESLTDDNTKLIEDYIKPALAFYVKCAIIGELQAALTNKGQQQPFSESSRTVDDTTKLYNVAWELAGSYKNIMIDYLNANLSLYPLFVESEQQKRPKKNRIRFY